MTRISVTWIPPARLLRLVTVANERTEITCRTSAESLRQFDGAMSELKWAADLVGKWRQEDENVG